MISPLLLRNFLATSDKIRDSSDFCCDLHLNHHGILHYVIATILKISSVEGRAKAFNTWASHLRAATFFFGSGLFVYTHPRAGNSLGYDKIASVF